MPRQMVKWRRFTIALLFYKLKKEMSVLNSMAVEILAKLASIIYSHSIF